MARNELGFGHVTINLNRTSQPDAPLALRVINVTSGSVTLKWVPGFDGGLGQAFRIRYKATRDEAYSYRDVHPSNVTQYSIGALAPDSEHIFNVMSYNSMGQSDYTADIVKAVTLKGTLSTFFLCSLSRLHVR